MVLQSGGLPSSKMARALHYRGLAYKKSGKPAQAIADLTSALWLKGGWRRASEQRRWRSVPRLIARPELGEPPAIDAGGSKATAAAPSSEPAARPALSAATAAPAPAQSAATEAPASSGGIGGFFSNIGSMFGSGPAQAEAPPPPQGVAAPAATGSVHAPPPPAVSSWSETKVSAAARPRWRLRRLPPLRPREPLPLLLRQPRPTCRRARSGGRQVPPSGRRSERERKPRRSPPRSSASSPRSLPVIRPSSTRPPWNMGTFYRVRVGPYANANEPRHSASRCGPRVATTAWW